jgi:sortase A
VKLKTSRTWIGPVLRWTQRLLFASSAVLLSYCAFVLGDAWLFQKRARQEFERRLQDKPAPGPVTAAAPRIGADGLIGRIDVPRIGLSAVIFEGTDRLTLRRAVGHIAYTPLPGQRGNAGLAGHRDSFFRPLKDIRRDDVITLTTLSGEYRYRVVSTRVVKPTEVSVLNPTHEEILTLVTCYPFYFVGSAPSRFIVRAERLT